MSLNILLLVGWEISGEIKTYSRTNTSQCEFRLHQWRCVSLELSGVKKKYIGECQIKVKKSKVISQEYSPYPVTLRLTQLKLQSK